MLGLVGFRAGSEFWDLVCGVQRLVPEGFRIQALGGPSALRLQAWAGSRLGRALGHSIFSLIGLKRILFTNIFQKL